MNRFETFQREDDRWAWRLIAGNGQIVATDGGQGYENRADCERIGRAVARGDYAPTDFYGLERIRSAVDDAERGLSVAVVGTAGTPQRVLSEAFEALVDGLGDQAKLRLDIRRIKGAEEIRFPSGGRIRFMAEAHHRGAYFHRIIPISAVQG